MVERVEIPWDGASAVYGSDAIAGVINIITKSDYSGTSATYQVGGTFCCTLVMTFTVGESSGNSSYVKVSLLTRKSIMQLDRNKCSTWLWWVSTPQGRFAYSGEVKIVQTSQ